MINSKLLGEKSRIFRNIGVLLNIICIMVVIATIQGGRDESRLYYWKPE